MIHKSNISSCLPISLQQKAKRCSPLQYNAVHGAQQPSKTHRNTKAFLYLHNSFLQAGLETGESSFEYVYGSFADRQVSFSLCKRTKPTHASSCKNSFLDLFSFQYSANGLLMSTIELSISTRKPYLCAKKPYTSMTEKTSQFVSCYKKSSLSNSELYRSSLPASLPLTLFF